jgi:hypothetical protein
VHTGKEFVVQVRFTVNLVELRRACRRLLSRLSDESESGTDFAVFDATGTAMELSTGNSSEVLDATIHRSGQAKVQRPVFSKLVSALRYFRGTVIEFEFSAGTIVLNGRTRIRHLGISLSRWAPGGCSAETRLEPARLHVIFSGIVLPKNERKRLRPASVEVATDLRSSRTSTFRPRTFVAPVLRILPDFA